MAETPEQPLLRSPSQQTAIHVGAEAQGTRSTKAYKVAGITLLACVLIVGQAAIAYFLLSQRSDIKSLKEQNNDLKDEMHKVQSGSMPMKRGMAAIPLQMVDFEEEGTPTGRPASRQASQCQMEASGLKSVSVPGFIPVCDERGLYKTQQCLQPHCWCVNAVTGEPIPNTLRAGSVRCISGVSTGGMVRFQPLADTDA